MCHLSHLSLSPAHEQSDDCEQTAHEYHNDDDRRGGVQVFPIRVIGGDGRGLGKGYVALGGSAKCADEVFR